MTEQERVDTINTQSVIALEKYLRLVEEDATFTEEQLLSEVYGGLVALELLGYSAKQVAQDAYSGAKRLRTYAEEQEAKQE